MAIGCVCRLPHHHRLRNKYACQQVLHVCAFPEVSKTRIQHPVGGLDNSGGGDLVR